MFYRQTHLYGGFSPFFGNSTITSTIEDDAERL